MSWGDLRRRRDAIATVLEHARRDPDAEISVEALGVRDVFTTRAELLLALQYDWTHEVWVQLQLTNVRPSSPAGDVGSRAHEAWHLAARSRPTLRAVLDRYAAELDHARAELLRQPVRVA